MILLIIFIALSIIALLQSLLNKDIQKRESYISLFFDSGVMGGIYFWDKENLFAFSLYCIVLIMIYFLVYYLKVFKPCKDTSILSANNKKLADYLYYVVIIIVPFAIKSDCIMAAFLALYFIANRIVFYRKHKAIF